MQNQLFELLHLLNCLFFTVSNQKMVFWSIPSTDYSSTNLCSQHQALLIHKQVGSYDLMSRSENRPVQEESELPELLSSLTQTPKFFTQLVVLNS